MGGTMSCWCPEQGFMYCIRYLSAFKMGSHQKQYQTLYKETPSMTANEDLLRQLLLASFCWGSSHHNYPPNKSTPWSLRTSAVCTELHEAAFRPWSEGLASESGLGS